MFQLASCVKKVHSPFVQLHIVDRGMGQVFLLSESVHPESCQGLAQGCLHVLEAMVTYCY